MLKLIGRTLNDFYVLVMIIFLLFDFLSIPCVFAVLEFLSPRRQDGSPLVASDNLLGLVFCE